MLVVNTHYKPACMLRESPCLRNRTLCPECILGFSQFPKIVGKHNDVPAYLLPMAFEPLEGDGDAEGKQLRVHRNSGMGGLLKK